jgi:hypothetical protein
MKHLLSLFLMLTLFACQKENHREEEPVTEPIPTVCKVATMREFPSVDGNNVLRTFTYDAANRVIKMDIQSGSSTLVTKSISYNAENKISKITSNDGAYEVFAYTNGVVTGFEAFNAAGNPLLKNIFTYESGKLVREDRYAYDAAISAYSLKDYTVFEWDNQGNIITAKSFTATNNVISADVYTYYSDKLSKQQTVTPQLEFLLMNWSNDITAFMGSYNLMKAVTSKKRNLTYDTNAGGWVTAIKTDRNDKLFVFTYGCDY